jgi:transcriptional regulator GlxA family with amidase domain
LHRRLSLLERQLWPMVERATTRERAFARAVTGWAAAGGASVEDLAKSCGVSARQLERLFEAQVGLRPKALSRVLRLRRLLATPERVAARGWAETAAEHGFADQSHLNREFKALTGVTPASYLRTMAMSDSSNPRRGPLAMMAADTFP